MLKGLHFICCCPDFYDTALKSFYTRLRPSTDKRALWVEAQPLPHPLAYAFRIYPCYYSQFISKVILWSGGGSSIETLFVHLFLQLFCLDHHRRAATTVVIVSPCLTLPASPSTGPPGLRWQGIAELRLAVNGIFIDFWTIPLHSI